MIMFQKKIKRNDKDFTMSQAKYRGVSYDTKILKEEYIKWYSYTHAPSRPQNTYRGIKYRPCRNELVAK